MITVVVVVVYCLINYAVAFLMGELVSVVHLVV